jgi:streptogramin lyase
VQALRNILWGFLVVICVAATLAAADVHGVVSDNGGKPLRGAMIKATAGNKTVARFTQADGRYDIALPPGSYALTVDAYGFGPKQKTIDAAQAVEANFSLTPNFDLARLTSAELESLLPSNATTKFITAACVTCHSFGTIRRRSGYTASEWQSFIPVMTLGRLPTPNFPPLILNALTQALEKDFGPRALYFGPDSDPPTPQQVKHADLSDAVLSATIREYTIPTGPDSMPHSILVDTHGDAWFGERGLRANKITRFEVGPETFDQYPAPHPHTGVLGKDGLIWMTLTNGPDLASVNPNTGKVTTYNIPNRRFGTHTLAVDLEGNIWCSGSSVWKFDVKKEQFKEYNIPLPATFPDYSVETWDHVAGQPPAHIDASGTFYDIKVDSKDMVWVSVFAFGELIRINPVTEETKVYHAPDSPSIRGLDVDAQDNVWFASFNGNSLGKLDPKTATFTMYHPPTRFAMPYGITADKNTGKIWFADLSGNNISRFDPNTGEFAEFPIPSPNAAPRFISLDGKGRVWFTEWMNGKIGLIDPGDESKQVSPVR